MRRAITEHPDHVWTPAASDQAGPEHPKIAPLSTDPAPAPTGRRVALGRTDHGRLAARTPPRAVRRVPEYGPMHSESYPAKFSSSSVPRMRLLVARLHAGRVHLAGRQ